VETVDQGKFSCGKCGKSYKWKPELAGKKVKCKCGNVMAAPKEEPVAEQQDVDLDGLYELAAEEKKSSKRQHADAGGFRCPSCHTDLAPGAVVCTLCGFNLKTGSRATATRPAHTVFAGGGGGGGGAAVAAQANAVPSAMVGYGTRATNTGPVEVDYIGDNPLRDFGVPAALLLAGVGVLAFQEAGGGSITDALPRIGLSLIINLIFSFIGMFAVMRLFEVSFGAPGPAIIKAAACCVLPPAIAGVIGGMVGSDSFFVRMMVSAILMMPLTYACFYFMFDMDFDEVIYLVVVIWLVNQWVVTFLLSMILSGGSGGGALAAVGGFGGGGGGDDSAEVSQDDHVKEMMGLYDLPKVDTWLAESAGRIFGDMGRGDCEKMVQDLKGMGAKNIYVNASGSQAGEIYVEMPKDKAKRKEMLEYHGKFNEDPPLKDVGQKWLIFEFI
jgi:hypothetical protein